jgi:hypothetical protein
MAEVELLCRTAASGAMRGTSRAVVANLRHAGDAAMRLRDAMLGSQFGGQRPELLGEDGDPKLSWQLGQYLGDN